MVTSLHKVFRQSLINHPFRWTVRRILWVLTLSIFSAIILGLIQVSLRYDNNEAERWFSFYFFNQLITWGQWTLWLPLFVWSITNVMQVFKEVYKAYALIIFLSLLLAFVATTAEAAMWHHFYNTSPDWDWGRVWKASISNNFSTHFLFCLSILLITVLRQFIYINKAIKSSLPTIRMDKGSIEGSLMIRSQGQLEFIRLQEISHLAASGSYVEIFSNGNKIVVTGTLKQFVEQLPPSHFLRIHRSYVVRVDQVAKLTPLTNEDYQVTTINGHQLRLSRSYKDVLPILKGTK